MWNYIDRFGRRAGFGLVVFGVCGIAAGVLAAIVLTEGLKIGFERYKVYSHNSKYDDASYTHCIEWETRVAYFYNLTNPDEVWYNGSVPFYDEVGPYKFYEEVCKFKEHSDQHWSYYKRYFPTPELQEGNGDTDLIYNFNPAYVGLTTTLAEQTGSTQPEIILRQRMTGPGMLQVLNGMFANDTFVFTVEGTGLPQVLYTIETTAVSTQIIPLVRTNAAVTAMTGVLTAIRPSLGGNSEYYFFNQAGVTYGLATYYTGIATDFPLYVAPNTVFTNTSVLTLLYFGISSPVTIKGWMNDTQAMAKWLSTYQSVASVPSSKTAYAMAYNVTTSQLDIIANYLNSYLTTSVANSVVPGGEVGINATALSKFYTQWANASVIPTGFDLNGDGISPDYFELGSYWYSSYPPPYPFATNLSIASTYALWNTTSSYSILSTTGIAEWLTCLDTTNSSLNSTTKNTLMTYNLLSDYEFELVLTFVQQWRAYHIEPFLMTQFGVSNLTDLVYAQWGNSAVLGAGKSIADSNKALPGPPEYAYWAYHNANGRYFTTNFTKYLFEGNLAFTSTGVIELFFDLFNDSDWSTLKLNWGFSQQQATDWAGYLGSFGDVFIGFQLEGQIFKIGGGPITWRTPREWLYNGTDPLLELLGATPYVGLYYDATHAPNYTVADTQEDYQEAIYRGGTRNDLKKFLEVKDYKGVNVIDFWNPPQHVNGNDGGDFWVPASIGEHEVVEVWNDPLVRPIPFKKVGEYTVKGIKLWKMAVLDSFWESATDYPANSVYYQFEAGLLNITPVAPAPSFISRPGFFGVDDTIRTNVQGVTSKPEYQTWFFGFNWESGFTMDKQTYYQISTLTTPYTEFGNNITSGYYIPFVWFDSVTQISDHQATRFKTIVDGANNGSIAAYVVGCVVGGLMTIVGFLILLRYRHRKLRAFEEQVKGMNLVELPEKF